MQTPEFLLSALNGALRELRGAVVVLNDVDIAAKLLPLMRNLMMAEVLGTEWLIAVGGSQGAGKTNLVSTMYGLSTTTSSDWLQPNQGQGEKYPVLIQEDEKVKAPQGYLRKLTCDEGSRTYKLETLAAKDIAEFRNACRGEMPEVMLPILKVPRKFFHENGQALILLPGYESSNQDNLEWQSLMRQVLIGAAGCVIVTDQTQLATQQQVTIVKDMLSNELRASQPLIVITKTEGYARNPQRLEELKTSAISIFKRKDNLTEPKVICTGSNDIAYIEQWMPDLEVALKDMSVGGGELRKIQLARLEKLIGDDLNRVTYLVHKRATLFTMQKNGGEGGPQETVKNCLQAFDEAAGELRCAYSEEVKGMLGNMYDDQRKELYDRLDSKYEGFKKNWKSFLKNHTELQLAIENDVSAAWNKGGSVLPKYAQMLDRLTKNGLNRGGEAVSTGHVLQQIGYMDENNQLIESKLTMPAVQANLAVLLKGTGVSTTTLEETTRLLPVLTLEYARIASVLPEMVGVNANGLGLVQGLDLLECANKIQADFREFEEVAIKVLKGLGAVLAVDIAADGKIDTIPTLLTALGITKLVPLSAGQSPVAGDAVVGAATVGGAQIVGTAAVGAVATIPLVVAGTVAIGFLAYSGMKHLRKSDSEFSARAFEMLISIQDSHASHFMAHFDKLMGEIRKQLSQSLRKRYALDQSLMEQDRLNKALADIGVLQRDILSELAVSGQTLQLFDATPA